MGVINFFLSVYLSNL